MVSNLDEPTVRAQKCVTISVHLYHSTEGVIKVANPPEVGFKSGDLEDSNQVPIVDPIKFPELIHIDQHGLLVDFYTL